MRILLLTIGLLLSVICFAQQRGTMYAAAKTGLSMRESPNSSAKVLDKIPYGTKITILETEEEQKTIIAEGMRGYWQKVKFNNKTGYIVDSYLLPWPPPKGSTIKEMKDYFAQISLPLGSKLVLKYGPMNNVADGGWQLEKQFYKNAAEWHRHMGHEYGCDTYLLPGFTIEQGFLLIRMIPEFKEVFGEKDPFPSESKTYKKGENEYVLKVDKEVYSPEFVFTKNIRLEYSDGAVYNFEMFVVGNQLFIVCDSGV